jgi:uncharacterized protein with HEPN domain
MHAEAAKLLWDARQAADRIARFTSGKSFADYSADEQLRSACEQQFEIIGEAPDQLARIDPSAAKTIPDLPRIFGFRNILIHGYATVDHRLVWGVIEGNLQPLRTTLAHSLDQV